MQLQVLQGGGEVALLLYRPSNVASVHGHVTGYKVRIFMFKLHTLKKILTLALHGGERGATCPACFILKEIHNKTTE